MKDNSNNIIGLVKYLKLDSIEELKKLPIDNDLIDKVGNYLLESKVKITTSKVAELLGINRASIYNTYPKSAQYLQALIAQQKAINNKKIHDKRDAAVKKNTEKSQKLNNLNKEKIERFMSIIMSLEYQNSQKNNQIQILKSRIISLESTINELKNHE